MAYYFRWALSRQPMSASIQPIDWIPGGGERNVKVNAIATELVKQAVEGQFGKYGRSDVETAIRVMAEVGDQQTIDSYVQDICSTPAIKAIAGEYYVTETGVERFKEEYADA